MKKITFIILSIFFTCSLAAQSSKKASKENSFEITPQTLKTINETGFARCLTDEYENALKKQNPNRLTTTDFEAWLAPKIAQIKADRLAGRSTQAVYNIPVVIHVVHNGDDVNTPGNIVGENISDAQALSQIQVLNEDFGRLVGTPGGANSTGLAVDVQLNFCIAEIDPIGAPTTGVVRHNISPYSNDVVDGAGGADWENNADVQNMKTTTQWDPTKYLNMWTIRPGGLPISQGGLSGLLGYAQFPDNTPNLDGLFGSAGNANTDGVVAGFDVMGTIAENDGSFTLNNNYNLGRTMTHEVGHWVGLRHIWGDGPDSGSCGVDDFCDDTPNASEPNYTCNLNTDTCPISPGLDQVQNYMDYTNDACMDTFTQDQKDRIQAIMASAPRRVELNSSTVCNVEPTISVNTVLPTSILEGSDCEFTDISIAYKIAIPASATATAVLVNNGTAVENEDFIFINNSVTFPAGSVFPSNFVTLRIFNDSFVELDETIELSVNVTTTGDAAATTESYITSITNDDVPVETTATVTYYSDNFDDEDISDWTITDADNDGNNFGDQFTINSVSNPSLISRSWINNVALTPDNWAVTPAIDLSQATGQITASWTTQVAAEDWDEEKYSIYVGNTNNISTLVTSTTSFTETLGDAGNTGSVISHTLDISAFAGQSNVHIAFRHWDTIDKDFLSIDNLTITGAVTTNIQTEVNTTSADQINLTGVGQSYATDATTNNIMLDIDNTGGDDYGCTTVAVSRDATTAGAAAVGYNGATDATGFVTAKTFDVTATNAVTGTATVSFYFTEAELANWETMTGQDRASISAKNETTSEVQPVTITAFGSDSKLTATFTSGLTGTYYFGLSSTLSVGDFELASTISIYPNPTVSALTIKVNNSDLPTAYQVYNMLGQLITKSQINNAQDLTIDTTPFSNGMYFIKISKAGNAITLPFIKK
ncbi:M43 family zinc metalloprotease [Olleya namhaensis]|uniref:M43 family zinc metalloprotease n=1 Tax=Olleya namhaensis TaxID=1144750 RepID=UPI00248F9C9D|nr:M43 family zinc metalloprotease [Olleya namhaensis]